MLLDLVLKCFLLKPKNHQEKYLIRGREPITWTQSDVGPHVTGRLDCSQSPIFPWDHRCRSFSSTGPSSWSLDASETGERTKCPWVGVVG